MRAGYWSTLTNDGCPDIQGTWDIKIKALAPNREPDNGMWPVFGLFERNHARKFETVTITGDSRKELTFRLEKSFTSVLADVKEKRAQQIAKGIAKDSVESRFLDRMDPKVRTTAPYNTMTDAEYAADVDANFPAYKRLALEKTARRGGSYKCDQGMLVELYGNELSPANAKMITIRLGVNKAGDLLRTKKTISESYFSFWCGDHCDNSIRLPDVSNQWWERRLATEPIIEPPPPWQVAFTPVAKSPPVQKTVRPPYAANAAEFRSIISAHLPDGVLLKQVGDSRSTWTMMVAAKSKNGISQFLLSLAKDERLPKGELIEITAEGNAVVGKILVRKVKSE